MSHGHRTFLTFVVQSLRLYARHRPVRARLRSVAAELLAVALLDLEPARPLLERCYAGRRGGRRPRDPVAMLRALVLMGLLGCTDFNKWVPTLRGRPELAILCGFDPRDTPGVGTFYAFCDRLLDGP